MLWYADKSTGPLPAVLTELGFTPDAMTRTLEGLELTPRTVHEAGDACCTVWLAAIDYALGYGIKLWRTPHGWDHREGWLCPDATVTWWEHVETDIGLPQTARDALDEALGILVGVTDDMRMEAMGG